MSDTSERTLIQNKLLSLTNEELSKIYQSVFNTTEGKLVLEDLRFRANPSVPSVPEDGIVDPGRVVYNEGKRAVFFYIETQLKPEIPVDTETAETRHSHPTEGE